LLGRVKRGFWTIRIGGESIKLLTVGATALLLLLSLGPATGPGPRAESLAAKTCKPSVAQSKKRLAPTLRVTRISKGKGSCPSWIAVIGGTHRDVWGANYNNGLWRSTDDLRTWRLVWLGPAGSHVERALRLATGRVLIEVVTATNAHRIMRSTTRTATRFSTRFVLPSGSFLHFSTSWGEYSPIGSKRRTIYISEYGNQPNPVHLWASTNDGRSFSPIFVLPGSTTSSPERIRHFHGVFLDPYTRWLWVAIGDTPPQPRIGYSKDGGRSFTWITVGDYPRSRAVGLMFARTAVYWGTDVPERPGALFRWDRATGAITQVITGLREPYFDARQSRGSFVQFSEVSTKENDGYIGDEHVHALVGTKGSWRAVTTPWVRNAAHKQSKAAPLGVTSPDRSGCFWLSFPNLGQTETPWNIKVCLGI
jgi:hypothetical protein